MKFSVILATRNRPGLFKKALDSVLAQRGTELEIIIVNDGSDEEHQDAYFAIEGSLPEHSQILHLPKAMNGHGQSYALNFGAACASGDYLCFLDDDDSWIDAAHLARAARQMASIDARPDLYFTCQHAYAGDTLKKGEIWLDGLENRLGPELRLDGTNAFIVQVADLLKATGFAHVNNTIIRRAYFEGIRGFDETLRYECDRDFYLRAVDGASSIIFDPTVISRHNIPDPAAGTAMSTMLGDIDKRLYQLRVLDKAISFSQHRELRDHAKTHKAFALQKLSDTLFEAGRPAEAFYYAREAVLLRPSLSALGSVLKRALRR
ncbi:MAG: glycosyltransferase family 2 protein [Alphaproteobacteria bacterium]